VPEWIQQEKEAAGKDPTKRKAAQKRHHGA